MCTKMPSKCKSVVVLHLKPVRQSSDVFSCQLESAFHSFSRFTTLVNQ